jgi:hypothetical protein
MAPVEHADNTWADNTWADETCADDEWAAVVAAIVADGPLATGPLDDTEAPAPGLAVAPGPALVRSLRDTDPSTLSDTDVIAYLQATERAIAWLGSLQADALVACAGSRSRTDHYEIPDAQVISIEDASRSEIAVATRWSEPWAHERIVTARLLAGPLPGTRAALHDGLITVRHADVLAAAAQRLAGFSDWADGADETDPHDPMVAAFVAGCRALEDATLDAAATRGVSTTRRSAERALLRIDAAHAAQRRKAERRHRDAYVVQEPDGMALLIARMGIAQAHACLSVIDATARDPRLPMSAGTPADAGIGERRAEALTWLILRPGASANVASANVAGANVASANVAGASADELSADGAPADAWSPTPVRTHVEVVIDMASLLGLDERPGTITGGGPGGPVIVAAEVIRALLAADETATMRRLVTDPLTGHLLDRGRSSYVVPTALRDFVVTRDGTCRFPDCGRRAGLAQIDHAIPWDRGGTSDRANLGALCIRHHQLKTHAGWRITSSDADGSARWRSPAGLDYEHSPPALKSDG